jgi:hypothetical protein
MFQCLGCKFTTAHIDLAMKHAYKDRHKLEKDNGDGTVITIYIDN